MKPSDKKPRYRLKMKKIVGRFLYDTTIDWHCYLVTNRVGGSKDSNLDYIGSIEHSVLGVTYNYRSL